MTTTATMQMSMATTADDMVEPTFMSNEVVDERQASVFTSHVLLIPACLINVKMLLNMYIDNYANNNFLTVE